MSTECANFYSSEDTFTGEETLTLPATSRELIITNNSGSSDLEVQFYTSMTPLTLEPTETLSITFKTKTIILSGTNIPYKVWSIY